MASMPGSGALVGSGGEVGKAGALDLLRSLLAFPFFGSSSPPPLVPMRKKALVLAPSVRRP